MASRKTIPERRDTTPTVAPRVEGQILAGRARSRPDSAVVWLVGDRR